MKIKVDQEFLNLCKDILSYKKSLREWESIESDDMFATDHYEGGYDATEGAFCFSYYDKNDKEYWIQLKLEEIEKIYSGEKQEVDIVAH